MCMTSYYFCAYTCIASTKSLFTTIKFHDFTSIEEFSVALTAIAIIIYNFTVDSKIVLIASARVHMKLPTAKGIHNS